MAGEIVQTAYVGRTHRPCGACRELVWIPEGCPHFHAGRVSKTRQQRNDAARKQSRRDVAAFQAMIYF
jgi:hypothetical protein